MVVTGEEPPRELRKKMVFHQETQPSIQPGVSGPGHPPGPLPASLWNWLLSSRLKLWLFPLGSVLIFLGNRGRTMCKSQGKRLPGMLKKWPLRPVPEAAVKIACSRNMPGCCSRVKGLWCCLGPHGKRDGSLGETFFCLW